MPKILTILKSVNAIFTDDHFVYTTGRHGEVYINKDALYPHTKETSLVCKLMAQQCQHLKIDTVVGPATGGIILSQWVAYHLSRLQKKEVFGVYAEKTADKSFEFKRGYDKYVKGKYVLVVEDIATTGYSVKKMVDVVRDFGGKVIGASIMVNRNPQLVTKKMLGAPLFSLVKYEAQDWAEADLPPHIAARPINTQMGHGKQYLAALEKG